MNMQNLEISPNVYYTPNEVAIMLRISRQSVKVLLESGLTRGVKIGRYWRILGRDLLQMSRAYEISDTELPRSLMCLTEPAFMKVWDNDKDSVYDEL